MKKKAAKNAAVRDTHIAYHPRGPKGSYGVRSWIVDPK